MALAACGPEPVAVLTGLEIVVAEGDEQFGTVGQTLTTPLRAVVRSEATQEPQEDVSVLFEIESGDATLITSGAVTTDEQGTVQAIVRLGASTGDIAVRASVVNQAGASVLFNLHTVETPSVTSVTPSSGAAGDTVVITGSNFSPVATQDVVLFSGIRGVVVAAAPDELRVLVPTCLPEGLVQVSVQLGVIPSGTEPFTVTGGGALTTMGIGDVLDVDDDAGFECYALPGDAGAEYLGVVYSASTVGAARHPYQLQALASSGGTPPAVGVHTSNVAMVDPQSAWDRRLRALEETFAVGSRGGDGPTRVGGGPASVPTVGERRTFQVWTGTNDFDEVSAVAEWVGEEVAVFVDEDAPAGGLDAADFEEFAGRFDAVIHPEVTSHFGAPSDLDGNERVIVLFTPVVNSLTPRGASGFIGGFFFGNDLLPENTGSNQAEVFYALVPDPMGLYSDARERDVVLDVVPALLAHEFQHMVQFNQRFLLLDGGQAALWMAEALAQMAEEMVARRYEALGDSASTEIFRSGTRSRAARYLADPGDISLIVTTGQGSLEERGAGFLFLLHLVSQEGEELLGRLSTTTRTGVANVEAEVGRGWEEVLRDWWAATYLDEAGADSGPLVYPGVDLADFLGPPFPLVPTPLGPGTSTEVGELWSSSADYFLVEPEDGGTLTLRLGGESGGASSAQASLRLRVVRIS